MDYLYNENVGRIIELLNELKASPIFGNIMLNMKSEFEQFTPYIVRTRIKSPFSMARKYYEIGCKRVMDMKDLYGFMIIVEEDDDVDKVAEYIKEKYRLEIRREKDYRKINPQNGYKSYHFNIGIQAEDISDEILVEIQIKTRSMLIAQETTHDGIYKRKDVCFKERKKLVAAMFPLFERIAYLHEKEKNGISSDEKQKIIDEIKEIYARNNNIYTAALQLMSLAWREYAVANFMQDNEREILANDFLHLGFHNDTITKVEARRVLSYLLDTSKEDEAITTMMNLSYRGFQSTLEKIEGRYLVDSATISGIWDNPTHEDFELTRRLGRNVQNLTAGVYTDQLIKLIYGRKVGSPLEKRLDFVGGLREFTSIGVIDTLDLKCNCIHRNTSSAKETIYQEDDTKEKNSDGIEIII